MSRVKENMELIDSIQEEWEKFLKTPGRDFQKEMEINKAMFLSDISVSLAVIADALSNSKEDQE